MDIKTKFDLRQNVFAIWRRHGINFEPCLYCRETGEIPTTEGSITCPKCYGRKGHVLSTPKEWRVVEYGEIANVSVDLYAEGGGTSGTTYMLFVAGSGLSGTMWPEDCLFVTQAEALAECARRNAEVK